MSDPLASAVLAWLGTYAIHSTALSLLVLALVRLLANDAWRHTLLSIALFAAPVTASLAPLGPGPAVDLARRDAVVEASPVSASSVSAAPIERPVAPKVVHSVASGPRIEASWSAGRRMLATAWVVIALGLALRRFVQAIVLRRRLARAPRSAKGARLGRAVALPASVAGRVVLLERHGPPFALGGRIYVPRLSFRRLSPRQQDAVLAHEEAHISRRDGWRFGAALAVRAVFFFQPLHRVVRRQLVHSAEALCDRWSVRRGNDPLQLARALTRMARLTSAPVPGPSAAGGGLADRVRKLTDDSLGGPIPKRWTRWSLAAVLVLGVTVALPSTRSGAAGPAATGVDAVTWVGWAFDGSLARPMRSATPEHRRIDWKAELDERLRPESVVVWVGFAADGEPSGVVFGSADRQGRRPPARASSWSGPLSDIESHHRIEGLLADADSPAVRAELAALASIHRDPRATTDVVTRILSREPLASVRGELVSWLGRRALVSNALAELVEHTAVADPDTGVQNEAIDALRRLGRTDALASLAESHPSLEMRSEAVEALARRRL